MKPLPVQFDLRVPENALDRGASTDARAAVVRAQAFAGRWQKRAAQARMALVQRLAELLLQRAEELAQAMAREIGKPIRFGRVEVQRTAEKLHAVVRRFEAAPAEEAAGPAVLRRRPHGVVAVITPYNSPIYLSLGKIVPAVLHGNTVVWKPSPHARALTQRLGACLADAGWPAGLVCLVEGGRATAVDLMSERAIAAVTITGSADAGAAALEVCSRRRIPLQAELGGNNAAIVWSDADLATAARLVAAGAFEMAGQRCTANRRVVVAADCRERFLQHLVYETAGLPWGDPLRTDTRIGPLVSASQCERVAGVVERAAAGCTMTQPLGPAPTGVTGWEGAWYPPTIVECEDCGHEIVQEETFGPVLVVQTARDWDHAMHLCNNVRQGLVAAVFTRSGEVAERFLDKAAAGILKVNQSSADAAVDVPFGGWKASGLGPPEHGPFDRDFFTRPQTVYGLGH